MHIQCHGSVQKQQRPIRMMPTRNKTTHITFALRGELPEELAAQYEQQRKALDALNKSLATIAAAIGKPLPELQDAATRLAGGGGQASVRHVVRPTCVFALLVCCSVWVFLSYCV